MLTGESQGRNSVEIEEVQPTVDCGRFPVKRILGDSLEVQADAYGEGHGRIMVALEFLSPGGGAWSPTPMRHVGNDRWAGRLDLDSLGDFRFRVSAWHDEFATAMDAIGKWKSAGEDIGPDLRTVSRMVSRAAENASGDDRERLKRYAASFANPLRSKGGSERLAEEELAVLMAKYGTRDGTGVSSEFRVMVDRRKAQFAAWYEMFHRSQGASPGRGATFKDCRRRLNDIKSMGFDVVYLPPIHPIGRTHRRGRNNSTEASPGDPGSPWAIGNEDGGHDSVNPDLGTMGDFEDFMTAVESDGMEVALDLAFQCSPDHPYVTQHPEWFYHREDGSIRYAENPPKKYFDIYPLNFESENWRELWEELRRVTLMWVSKGVKTFRVDNPHTKPFAFWEWLITEVRKDHPDVIFLAEAFTAPKPMKMISKLGFSQSYTYFTWKNSKWELEEFLREFVLSPAAEYYRGNFFTNTPDILHAYLQTGGRPAFKVRLVLAATLSSLYGIYNGFELCEGVAKESGSEEYANSEKYEFKVRNWDAPGNIKDYISKVNAIRRENRALQSTRNLRLLEAEDENVVFYAKWTPDRSNIIAVAVNLDPSSAHESVLHLPGPELGVSPGGKVAVHDLLSGSSWKWEGETAIVKLDPLTEPAAILRLERLD